ncbi:sensor histidine kinase [Dactylosporangium sp. CA-139066]|uniref:sensor histidine kinase n=1 Tax=Dactylosporangium sp. CA-139066 TaxID=3239930 RepID=UPI003D8AD75F
MRRSGKQRGTRLRSKVIALLLSLVALWAFAAWVTLREGLNVLWVSSLDGGVGRPTESLVAALQAERRLSVIYHASAANRDAQRQALGEQRKRTDEAIATFRTNTAATSVSLAADGTLKTRIRDLTALLDRLPDQRAALDASTAAPASSTAGDYTKIIDAAFRVYGSISALDDPEIAKESRTLIALTRARETLSQEDALLSGVFAVGRFTGTEPADFAGLVSVARYAYAEASADLPSPEREQYDRLIADEALTRLRAVEDKVIANARPGSAAPVTIAEWTAAISGATDELRQFELVSADQTLQRATPAVIGVIVRLLLAGGLGLIAVIASIVISITTARKLLAQLIRLRDAADELAGQRLPAVMAKLSRGETVDVTAEAPPLEFGTDEIGQVGRAFNAVQESAVRAAVQQAELRQSVRDVFYSLARRTQTLVHRQLRTLDAMERQETDTAALARLFSVDHLATRMRRNAENLIVLAGGKPGRTWRRPVAMVDVVRAALAEIEDYGRVNVHQIPAAGLAGRVVADAVHLLAELIENAASFSPPHTSVDVSGQVVGNGYVVEIVDRGLGMSDAALEQANEQLTNTPEFMLTGKVRLGLYVVGRLADRHGIRVQLRHSPYGGATAIVLFPNTLIVPTGGEQAEPLAALDAPAEETDADETAAPAAAVGRPVPPVIPDRDLQPAISPAPPASASADAAPPATVFGLPRRQRRAAQHAASGSAADSVTPGSPVSSAPTPEPERMRTAVSAFQAGLKQAGRLPRPEQTTPAGASAATATDEQP